jgi:dUTP pyrophosphatase
MESLQIKKLNLEATLPTRAHVDDAGMDLYGAEDAVLKPGEGRIVKTGIAMAIAPGFVGMIADRSSMSKKGIKTAGGIIDSGYRGEIGVVLWNISTTEIRIARNDRIAQMLIIPISTPKPLEVSELTDTPRGAGGFGSTGK